MEDDPMVMGVLCLVLQSYGFRILSAVSGHEALEQFGRCRDEIDLLIADLMVPDNSGVDVALHCSLRSAKLRIIITSGAPPENWDDKNRRTFEKLGSHRVAYLQKPFSPSTLLQTVNSVLERSEEIYGEASG